MSAHESATPSGVDPASPLPGLPPPPLGPAPYRTQSRHGNPYAVAEGRLSGILGAGGGHGSAAVRDIGDLRVGRGLLHQDFYWTVRFRDAGSSATDDAVLFFKTQSAAEEMVRQIRIAQAGSPKPGSADATRGEVRR